jgi:Arc/MetJ-type ribon-helix-helix transcriptional regulator
MKSKLSISMEDSTIRDVENKIDEGLFRNKSHFIEYAVKKLLKEDN